MTVDVSGQSAYAVLTQPDLAVAEHTAYVVVIPGRRATVASHSVYAVILPAPAPTGRRRRVAAVMD